MLCGKAALISCLLADQKSALVAPFVLWTRPRRRRAISPSPHRQRMARRTDVFRRTAARTARRAGRNRCSADRTLTSGTTSRQPVREGFHRLPGHAFHLHGVIGRAGQGGTDVLIRIDNELGHANRLTRRRLPRPARQAVIQPHQATPVRVCLARLMNAAPPRPRKGASAVASAEAKPGLLG